MGGKIVLVANAAAQDEACFQKVFAVAFKLPLLGG
jgi:hypothetical protein